MDVVLYSHRGDNPINYLEATEMFKLIFKKTNEELIFDTREEAEMCLKLSVMVNNRTTPRKRDSKRNYEIVEL